MKRSILMVPLFAIFLFAPVFNAGAGYLDPVSEADYSGSISTTGGGLTATGAWSAGSTLTWEVVKNGDNTWTYTYTFSVPSKEISHVIIEVSDAFEESNILGSTPQGANLELGEFGPDDGDSNPGMPDSIKGLKWDELSGTTYTFSVTTDKSPVWGNFYSKDGSEMIGGVLTDVYAYNTGFVSGLEIGDEGFFVPVPDTTTVPVPPALVLLGSGLVALVGLRRRGGLRGK